MKNLLVVDDSLTVRKVIEMLLVPLGYRLTFAEQGKGALERLKSGQFDIAVIDLGLPDMDGITLSKEIKKSYPNIKVLLMHSGKEELNEQKLKAGFVDDVLPKPFDSSTIISKLEELSASVELESEPLISTVIEEKPSVEETFKIDIGVGEEFTFQQKTEKEEVIEAEEIEELSDLELLGEEEEIVENKENVVEEEISLEDLLEEGEIKLEEEPPLKEATKEEVTKVDIEELFSDLNDILTEKEPTRSQKEEKLWQAKDVKPVVEEVAKDLKELEAIIEEEKVEKIDTEEIEELDVWDFTPEEEKEEVSKPVETPITEKTFTPVDTDRASLEKLIREITYEVVEKIAWEVVPEIVDTIIKDKFGKK